MHNAALDNSLIYQSFNSNFNDLWGAMYVAYTVVFARVTNLQRTVFHAFHAPGVAMDFPVISHADFSPGLSGSMTLRKQRPVCS